MADPALYGYREQVGAIVRFAELVAEDDRASDQDRAQAAKVVRQGKGLWRQLDRWRREQTGRRL